MMTDRLRLETGLLTRTEKLRYAVELLADVTQVEPVPQLREDLVGVVWTLRHLLSEYRW